MSPATILRIRDENGVWTEIVYRAEDVAIYRRDRPIGYFDVNPGDHLTVRFKSA